MGGSRLEVWITDMFMSLASDSVDFSQGLRYNVLSGSIAVRESLHSTRESELAYLGWSDGLLAKQ